MDASSDILTFKQKTGITKRRLRRAPVKTTPSGFKCVNKLVSRAIGKVLTKARGRDKSREWRSLNKEYGSELKKSCYRRKHKEYRESQAEYRKQHRDEDVARSAEYYKNNKKRLITGQLVKKKQKRKVDPSFVFNERCHTRLKAYFKKNKTEKTGTTRECVDMHIDHIFPVCIYSTDQEKLVMNFSNLQLLTNKENLWKKDRLPTKAMAAKVERWAWPPGITEDMLSDIYPGWSTPLRM